MTQTVIPNRVRAVIFVPPGLSLDGHYAAQCVAYVLNRGYQLAAIFRDWGEVDAFLSLNGAQVVVVARGEHRGDRQAEVVGERTEIITWRIPAVGRCSVQPNRSEVPSPGEIAAYRAGYGDGYVDCLTVSGRTPLIGD